MSWRRRDVLAGLAAAGALTACGAPASTRAGAPETPEPATDKEAPMDASSRMPVLFVGHGSPMNAIEDNRWAQGFAALSEGISRPKAILAIVVYERKPKHITRISRVGGSGPFWAARWCMNGSLDI